MRYLAGVQLRTDYDFDLPAAQIAQHPPLERGQSRLLDMSVSPPRDLVFDDIVDLIPSDAVLIVNDTRVLKARLLGQRPTGGALELLLLHACEVTPDGEIWRALAKARRPLRKGQVMQLAAGAQTASLEFVSDRHDDGTIDVRLPSPALPFIETWGALPLPPYIERAAAADDDARYQTVFAASPGAVAAPTAGLHFTPALLAKLDARGIARANVTLHVGLGTFSPMRALALAEHVMHRERYDVPAATADLIASGRPIVAVGTTVMRTLEAAAIAPKRVRSGPGDTDLFLYPGKPGLRFWAVDALITNFHLAQSTLLMLVCAYAGYERTLAAYRLAVGRGYRFFSYGDAMYVTPDAAWRAGPTT